MKAPQKTFGYRIQFMDAQHIIADWVLDNEGGIWIVDLFDENNWSVEFTFVDLSSVQLKKGHRFEFSAYLNSVESFGQQKHHFKTKAYVSNIYPVFHKPEQIKP